MADRARSRRRGSGVNRLAVVVLVLIVVSVALTFVPSGGGHPLSWTAGFLCGVCGALLWIYRPWRR